MKGGAREKPTPWGGHGLVNRKKIVKGKEKLQKKELRRDPRRKNCSGKIGVPVGVA